MILTDHTHQHRYENLVNGQTEIESSLHNNLLEHVNAGICRIVLTSIFIDNRNCTRDYRKCGNSRSMAQVNFSLYKDEAKS